MRDYVPLTGKAIAAFDMLMSNGVQAQTIEAEPFLACFREADEGQALVDQLSEAAAAGLPVEYDLLDGQIQNVEPLLSDQIRAAVRIYGQRYVDPVRFTQALADAVIRRGAHILAPLAVHDLIDDGRYVHVVTDHGERRGFDVAVVTTGAQLPVLTRKFGVRHPTRAGRGYSFSVRADHVPDGPIYLPAQRIACTPLDGRLRLAGMMEFRPSHAPLDDRRVATMVEAARPLLETVDLDDRTEEWVGSRPVTADGLPLIGPTASPRVHVAGGHGMWGMVLGPITGQLTADAIVSGRTPPDLLPFDPLRR